MLVWYEVHEELEDGSTQTIKTYADLLHAALFVLLERYMSGKKLYIDKWTGEEVDFPELLSLDENEVSDLKACGVYWK